MTDLRTRYMGIELKNPVIAGASDLSNAPDKFKRLEDAGVGAIVAKSLFEEQIQLERTELDEDLEKFNYRNPEMITVFPNVSHAGPREHLVWLRKAVDSVDVPVIGSLNAVEDATWIEWAQLLADTGVAGLELNFYHVPDDYRKDSGEIESRQIGILSEILKKVKIPVSVKLSYSYTNPLNVITRIAETGVAGMVVFNRFFEPDIDVWEEKEVSPLNLSHREDNRIPLRFAGLLGGRVKPDICCSTGIYNGEDVVKMILAGASCVQVVSALYRNGTKTVAEMLEGVSRWMEQRGYETIDSFKARMSGHSADDPWRYARAQYVDLLMKPEKIVKNAPVI